MTLPWGLALEPSNTPGLATRLEFDAGRSRLTVSVTNTRAEPLPLGPVEFVAHLNAPAAGGSLWLHGRYMQQDALIRNLGEPEPEGYQGAYVSSHGDGCRYRSAEVLVAVLPALPMPGLLIGCVQPSRCFFDVSVDVDADETHALAVTLRYDLRGVTLAPGETHALPEVLVLDGRDPQSLIARFADEVAAEMHARVPAAVPTGWCSWYYFYNRVSEADIRANLAEMVASGHPAEFVQVDDGYQSHTGDWLHPNEKFPSGMAALAKEIAAAGYRPGLWLAPLVMHEDSLVLREHPEFALKLADGATLFVETWLGRCAVLDCTHPGAAAWLREVIGTVVREWGYTYLKLDAMSFAAQDGSRVRYHTPNTTAPQNLRRGLEIIREAAGDETFILGCTCHFGPAVGLVDAMRVGPDVKELWSNGPNPSVKHAMRLTLQRNWMHRRWWVNDPDCLIVRDTDTVLTEAEVRFLATGIALSGGMVVASDDLPKLPESRREMALALFPPAGIAAEPVDSLEGPVPLAWRADLGDGRFFVGVLNWGDEPRWVRSGELLRPGEVAFDIWNGTKLGMGDILLRPHEGTLWQVTGPGAGLTPRVAGDSGHVNYDQLYQRQVSGRIQLRNDLPRPRVVGIETRGQVFEVELAPGEKRWFD